MIYVSIYWCYIICMSCIGMFVDFLSEIVDKNLECLWKLKCEIWNLIDSVCRYFFFYRDVYV